MLESGSVIWTWSGLKALGVEASSAHRGVAFGHITGLLMIVLGDALAFFGEVVDSDLLLVHDAVVFVTLNWVPLKSKFGSN